MAPKMNVLILHCDQLRYDGLGCNGNPHARTPNIDALAAEGTVFTRHIAANPICMPSRASLLTGLYPPGHNVWTNGVALNRRQYEDPTGEWSEAASPAAPFQGHVVAEPRTLADLFAENGYDTAAFGKLHLTPWLSPAVWGYPESIALWRTGRLEGWHGPYYGFRYVDMVLGHGEGVADVGHYAEWLAAEHPELFDLVRSYRSGERARELPVPELDDLYASVIPSQVHCSAWLGERFADYLDREKPTARPFFAFIGFPDPHHPFTPSHDIAEAFEDADVPEPADPDGTAIATSPSLQMPQNNVRSLTREQRRLVIRYTYAMVHQIDMAVGRIVRALKESGRWDRTIIVFTSDHGDFLCDHGLLRKSFIGSHPLLRVPFVLRAPGCGLPDRVDVPMSNCDVVPTLARLAGVAPPPDVHGTDILPLVRDGGEHEAFVYGHNGCPDMNNYGVYDTRYRLAYYPHRRLIELYDHLEDPNELHNIAGRKETADVTARLMDRLRAQFLHCANPILRRVGFW